ncbi:hypothetical protein GA0061096_2316 [Fictibacillus enclensis]|uniref:DUF2157 domain-containing protein n=1 Tax=Fictibacillus enclensis TaxID=1017270 RepID=A0A0V8J8F3_9BACL|nr:hypothetical protein [Fictibacillus enclensis]KSU83112.1 hypothetical protein AS030_11020 [Fictibacillus enclensis]SCC10263.1 hypothetical protein GA0061096_2316 [Fictibacillus enclensis]
MKGSEIIKDLFELKEKGYIKYDDYLKVVEGINRYEKDQRRIAEGKEPSIQTREEQEPQFEKEKDFVQPVQQPILSSTAPAAQPLPKSRPRPVPTAPPKPALSAEQKRERNLTLLMAAGVILLLIGGLTLATSQWEVFTPLAKTMLVGGIAALFGGLGALSQRVLHIKKTAFASFVLFALFLPITILSAGFFKLFGSWLSFSGDGKYVLGAITSLVCLPIYWKFAKSFGSRLFVWFTLIASGICYGFILLALGAEKNVFYFLYALGNGAYIYLYHLRKTKDREDIYQKVLPVFIQTNLILSSVLIIVSFEQPLSQSFNLILTAALYLAMRMVNKRVEYELLFMAFISYGLYQLVEQAAVAGLALVLIPVVPVVLLAVARFSKGDLKKYYHVSNAVVSVIAFLLVTGKGLMLSGGEGSVWMLLGYLVVAGNFIYLSYSTAFRLFSYLASFYIFIASSEVYHLTSSNDMKHWALAIGLSGLVTYAAGQWIKPLRRSGLFVGGAFLLVGFGFTLLIPEYWQMALLSLVLTGLAARHYRLEEDLAKKMASAGVSVFGFFTGFSSGMALIPDPDRALSIGIGTILLAALYYWRKNDRILGQYAVMGAIFASFISFLASFSTVADWVRLLCSVLFAFMVFVGTRYFKQYIGFGIVQAGLFFVFYSFLHLIAEPVNERLTLIILSALLFVSGEALKRADRQSHLPTLVVSQAALLYSVFYTFITSGETLPYFLLTVLYGLYVWRSVHEAELKYSLYAGLTVLSMAFGFTVNEWFPNEIRLLYSLVMLAAYFVVSVIWKERLRWYIVPFSILVMAEYLADSYYAGEVLPLWFYVGVVLVFMAFFQSLKGNWRIAVAFPLIYFWLMMANMIDLYSLSAQLSALVWYAIGLLFTAVGMFIYEKLYHPENGEKVDLYGIAGLIYVCTGCLQAVDWVFIGGLFVVAVLLYHHSLRIAAFPMVQKSLQTVSLAVGLLTYYTILDMFHVPSVIITELYVLPWILLSYLITQKTWNLNEKSVMIVQYSLIGLISIILMVDAMYSYKIADAVILGSLAVLSILYGFISKQKSYFFSGLIVLIVNVFVQTRPYWGNMPWWVYLLMAGILLIGFAGYHEFKKQKGIESPSLKEQFQRKWGTWFGAWK